MANTEMNYVEGGGIYELARVTATSSTTPRQVLNALVTQAGDSLTWAANNRLRNLKIEINSCNEYCAQQLASGHVVFSSITGASNASIFLIRMDLAHSDSTLKNWVFTGATTPTPSYADYSTKTISELSSNYVGDWVLYYE